MSTSLSPEHSQPHTNHTTGIEGYESDQHSELSSEAHEEESSADRDSGSASLTDSCTNEREKASGSDPRPSAYISELLSPHTPEPAVTIQAGDRHFTTLRTTLMQGSGYYRALFSGNWRDCPQPDGSYFVDVDEGYFEHVLRFIRHSVFPRAIYNAENVIDKEFYKGLADVAAYLEVDELYEWLKEKKYNDFRA